MEEVFTVRNANNGMHPAFCFVLLELVSACSWAACRLPLPVLLPYASVGEGEIFFLLPM